MDSKEEAQKVIGLQTKDYWYDLPEELIAQTPLQKRDTSRFWIGKPGKLPIGIFMMCWII